MNRVFVHVDRVVLRGVVESDKHRMLSRLDGVLREMAVDHRTWSESNTEGRALRVHLDSSRENSSASVKGWSSR
jgi:hypothetical protein